MVAQIPPFDLLLSSMDQRHDTIDFLSGYFRDSELEWFTLEKEAYVVMAPVT